MRHLVLVPLMAGTLFVSACEQKSGGAQGPLKDLNVIDESDLSDVMTTVADPNEAVAYFQRTSSQNPDRIDLKRNLAQSLDRAKRATEATVVWADVINMKDSTNDDKVMYAASLVRANQWKMAEEVLDSIPPTHETFERYRLEAMVADGNKEWKKADSFYQTALGLTTTPAPVLNNWGFSKLSRGEFGEAERLFTEALNQDRNMFTAKNNLVLARGAQRNYTLPVMEMSQTERAQLLYTLALSAIKQGDVETGKNLLRDAISTHPQHFEEAVNSLRALEGS